MTVDNRRYLDAYEISLDRTRNRVAKVLKSYGSRGQFSVYLVAVAPARARRMVAAIEDLIDLRSDSVMICDLGPVNEMGTKRLSYLGAIQEQPSDGPLVF